MDRAIVYPGALPQDTDLLNTNIFALINAGFKNAALVGTSTAVAGLAVTPTTPTASLQVNVATGSIFQLDEIDASAYGSLGTNTSTVVKQGILPTAQVLTITPPGTSGFSQVYLVQAILNDIDAGSTVLSYYNSANPAQPFSGPANSGSSNYTIRQCRCVIALKAGTPASTGTQVAPTPDAGYVGLFTITVANGQTQITSGNIAQLASAPFFPTLPQVPYQVQQGTYVYAGQDTGTANNYVITFAAGQPIPAALTNGLTVKFKALNTNTGASVINVQGLGNVAIKRATGTALSAGDITSGGVFELTYDGTAFQMANYNGTGSTSNTTTAVNIPYVADTGTQNAVVATFSPAITSGQQIAGLTVEVKLANTITGACTINVNGLGAKAIKTGDLQNPPNGLFVANEVLLLIYDGTQYQVSGTTSLIYKKPVANTTLYVNASTGSDTLYDGTSASVVGGSSTAGPLATISKAVTVAFGYAPSQYTITISIAAGTYNEAVQTPLTAGPAIIIDGGSASSVTINSGSSGAAIVVSGPNTMTVKNVTVQSAASFGGIGANRGASMITTNTASNAIGGSVFGAGTVGNIQVGQHTFNGSCQALFNASAGGIVQIPDSTAFTIGGSIAVSFGSAYATGGTINAGITNPPTFANAGLVSGPKYNISANGVVYSSANFPGSAGSTASGGQAL